MMKSFVFTLIALAFTFGTFSQSLSPEVVASSGNYFENGNVSLSWTIGECVIETFQNTSTVLTQGFHQTKLSVTKVETLEDEELVFSVYPNPANNKINIEIKGAGENTTFSYALFDINGKMISNKKITSQIETIDVSSYPAAYYILNLQDGSGSKVGTYKILKQN